MLNAQCPNADSQLDYWKLDVDDWILEATLCALCVFLVITRNGYGLESRYPGPEDQVFNTGIKYAPPPSPGWRPPPQEPTSSARR